nr:hypothetical protein [uncultured Lichenicoccus sp.]
MRLAQRVPARIAIREAPDGIPLVSGMTVTVMVTVTDPRERRALQQAEAGARPDSLGARLRELVRRPQPRANCIPADRQTVAPVASLQVPQAPVAPTAAEIIPGLVSGMRTTPRLH